MSLRENAQRVAILGALKDAIATQYAEARGELLEELVAAHDTSGMKSAEVSLPDGTKVASVTLTQPSGKPEVVDEAAFTKWVAENYPTEVETTVRPAFRKAFLERLTPVEGLHPVPDDSGWVFDPKTGELIAAVRWRPGVRPNSFSLRYTPEGRPAIAEAWRAGRLAGHAGPPVELEGGQ